MGREPLLTRYHPHSRHSREWQLCRSIRPNPLTPDAAPALMPIAAHAPRPHSKPVPPGPSSEAVPCRFAAPPALWNRRSLRTYPFTGMAIQGFSNNIPEPGSRVKQVLDGRRLTAHAWLSDATRPTTSSGSFACPRLCTVPNPICRRSPTCRIPAALDCTRPSSKNDYCRTGSSPPRAGGTGSNPPGWNG